MFSYFIDTIDHSGFVLTYIFNEIHTRPIKFGFIYNCMSPFNYKQINEFIDNSIDRFYFTDNIYFTKKSNELSLTYYMYIIKYDHNDTSQILNILKLSLDDILKHKLIISLNK
jgi:hypothetical protein